MDRIDELLEKATPDLARRDRLRSLHAEWERVKAYIDRREQIHLPLIVREEPTPEAAGVVIAAADAEELEQIRAELAEAGVPIAGESPPRTGP